MEQRTMNISSKDILINKGLWHMKDNESKKKGKILKIAERPRFDFSYSLFYIPKRVVEEYNNGSDVELTRAVMKRKLSAMVYATMHIRELLENDTYIHRFNTIEIVVNHKARVIKKVTFKEKLEEFCGDLRLYKDLCNDYELDSDRVDFVGMKKYCLYGKDNMTPVRTQIRKKPNRILWSDDDGNTWHSYVNCINTTGYSIVNGKRKYWIYKLK